jgi:hypothetical protein
MGSKVVKSSVIPVSKISSASVGDMRAATSSNFGEKFRSISQWIHLRVFARFPRLASQLVNLATKIFSKPEFGGRGF